MSLLLLFAPSSGGSGGLAVATHPDYNVVWAEDQDIYLNGETFPLKWTITRKDGANVAVPSTASVVITQVQSGDLVETLTPDLESGVAALTQVLAADWTPPGSGSYYVELSAHVGAQVRSQRQLIVVEA